MMRLILACVLAVHVVAVVLFAQGFFLTRYALTNVNICRHEAVNESSVDATGVRAPPLIEATGASDGDGDGDASCWLPRRYERVALLVIDALRFDFCIAHNDSDDSGDRERRQYSVNGLPVLRKLLVTRPRNALLFRFTADAPTVTMQRLKGMTTGSLPTFIDVRSNFAASRIDEDAWLSQAARRAAGVTRFVGDDTWTALFPDAFSEAHAYPSFNVKDLDTVDAGVAEHFVPMMTRDAAWRVVVGHCLGVDHVGHRYGMEHPAMRVKMREMNALIERAVDALPDDALLVLLGDHGMTPSGDHGGASAAEVDAALFVYAKRPILRAAHRAVDVEHRRFRRVDQIDLVPTLALLLDLPVPFGNLGRVIDELFLGDTVEAFYGDGGGESDAADAAAERRLLDALRLNAHQVQGYLRSYAAVSRVFPPTELAELELLVADANRLAPSASRAARRAAVDSFTHFLRRAARMCRRLWANFDLASMLVGLALFYASLLALAALVRAAPRLLSAADARAALLLHAQPSSRIERKNSIFL